MTSASPLALIVGCAGPELTGDERALFSKTAPFGFILFQRNCQSPTQVKRLVQDLRVLTGRDDAPILIDQEGGRVARLKPPHWPLFPAAQPFERLDTQAVHDHGRLIGNLLASLGISVNCAPVCDIPTPGSHDVIGDRAFGTDPARVAELSLAMAQGLMVEGVLPIMKHIPGHGRAMVDSHHDLPVVSAPRAALEATDFAPFRALSKDIPLAMTAHVTYTALDPDRPATLSSAVINAIRRDIGFDGLLIGDDVSMKALDKALPGKTLAQQACATLDAGVDVVLHCNGNLAEMDALARRVPTLSVQAQRRWAHAKALLAKARCPHPSLDQARQRMAALFEGCYA